MVRFTVQTAREPEPDFDSTTVPPRCTFLLLSKMLSEKFHATAGMSMITMHCLVINRVAQPIQYVVRCSSGK